MEKSELWVYKGQGPDETMDGVQGENEHKKKEVMRLFPQIHVLIFYEDVTVSRNVTKKKSLQYTA